MLYRYVFSFFVGLSLLSVSACVQQKALPPAAEHKHALHGPHDGELLEVGNEEYHVELLVDETKKQVDVYLLDNDAKKYVPIDSPDLDINLLIQGKPTQFKLIPVPQEEDKNVGSSRFVAESPELVEAIHDAKSQARLSLRIRNKAYSVKIVHEHDHSGNDHSGHGHADHAQSAEQKNSVPKKR